MQRHFIEEGIGLRQITDYCLLLKNSTPDDRAAISAMLGDFGMKRFSAALMYVLKSIYNLDESLMLCPPDEKLGKILLSAIIAAAILDGSEPTANKAASQDRWSAKSTR